jgi:hypothetical protein
MTKFSELDLRVNKDKKTGLLLYSRVSSREV